MAGQLVFAHLPFVVGLGCLAWGLAEITHGLLGFRDSRDPPRKAGPAIVCLVAGALWVATTYFAQRHGNVPAALICFVAGLIAFGYSLRA